MDHIVRTIQLTKAFQGQEVVSNVVKGDISQIDVNNIHSLKIQVNAASREGKLKS
ncbi:hypothetical protein M3201_07920 [Paenibacillus motobuensis]|uniref:hypothetical protein n=1 Tax=Paenibacillus TaxID=44249 RepID=UPI00203F32CC|nr:MULTISPECIES: hypothetical protein [Paenibacillus]MCM3039624.1 hypothetical protein [Paenibacillus lutimineralis]MCM3646728.1 hypothetical protein [Paenibacillus motobuensis]